MISRTTAVFAFESALATHKRWNARHKNGKSEGSSMFRHFWVDNMVNLLIAVNEPSEFEEMEKNKLKEMVLKLHDDTYYIVRSERYSQALEIRNVCFDSKLLFMSFCSSDITSHRVSISHSEIQEKWSVVKVRNHYFMYDCFYI
jgi:hypothetical protein